MSLSLQYARVSSRSVVAAEVSGMERSAVGSARSGRRSMRAFTCGSTVRMAPRTGNAADSATPAAAATNAASAAASAPSSPSTATQKDASRQFSTAAQKPKPAAAAKKPPATPPVTPPVSAPSAASPSAAAAAVASSPGSLRIIHSKLEMLVKNGATHKAEDLWSRMVASGQKPEAETYRLLLCVYLAASGQRIERPRALREEMQAAGLKFSAGDYDALLSEAAKRGKSKDIAVFAREAKAAGLVPRLRTDVQAIVTASINESKQKNKNGGNAAAAAQNGSNRFKRNAPASADSATSGSAAGVPIPSAADIEDSVASAATTPASISAKLAELSVRANKIQAALGAASAGSASVSGSSPEAGAISKLVEQQRELVADAEQHWASGLRLACLFPRDTLSMMNLMAASGKYERMADVMLDAARLERVASTTQGGQIVERIDVACLKALFDALSLARERPGIDSVIDRAYQFFLLRYGSAPEAKLPAFKPIVYSYFKCLSRVRDQQLIREFIELPAIYKADHPDLFALVWRAIESSGATDFTAEAAEVVAQMSAARCKLTANQAGVWLSAQTAEGADTVWRLMGEQGLEKNAMHYAQLMQSYLESEDAARVAKVEDLYAEMLEAGLELTAPLYEALVGSARDLDLDPIAERWITRAREKGVQVNRALISPREKWTPQQQQEQAKAEAAEEQAEKDGSAESGASATTVTTTRTSSLLAMHRASPAPADIRARDVEYASRLDSGLPESEVQPSGRKVLTDFNVVRSRRREHNLVDEQRNMLRESLKKHHVLNLFPAVEAAEAEAPTTAAAAAADAATTTAPTAAPATDKPAESAAAVAADAASDALMNSAELRRALDAMLDVQNEALLQFPTAAAAVVRREMLQKSAFKILQAKAGKSIDRVLSLLRSGESSGAPIPFDSFDWLAIMQCCDTLFLWDKALPAYKLMIQMHVSAAKRAALSQPPLEALPFAKPPKVDSARAEREAELDARDPNPFPKVSSSTFPDSLITQRMLSCVLQGALYFEPLQAGDQVLRYFNYLRRARYPINAECAAIVLRGYANSMPRRLLSDDSASTSAAVAQVRLRYDALAKLPWIATEEQRGPTRSLLAAGMLGIYTRQRDHPAFEDLWAQITKQGAHLTPVLLQRRLEQISLRIEELMMEEYQLNRVSNSMSGGVGTSSGSTEARLSNTTSIAIEHLRSDALELWAKAIANPGALLSKNVVQCMLMVGVRLKDTPMQLEIADTALSLEKKLIPPPRMRKVVAEVSEGEDKIEGRDGADQPANASAPPAVTYELDPDAPSPAGPVLLGGLSLTTLIHSLSEDRAPWQHVELVHALYEGYQRRYQQAVEQGHWTNASGLMLNDALVATYQRFLQRAMFFTHASEHDKVLHAGKKESNWRYFLAQMTIASMQGDVEMARTVVSKMEEANVPYNRSIFTAQLTAAIEPADWAEAERVWLKALSLNIPLDSFAYSRLMQVYLSAGGEHLAKIDALREEMARNSLSFDASDYMRLFQSCYDLRNAAVLRVFYAQSQRDGTWLQLPPDAKRQALTVESWRSLPPQRLNRNMRRRMIRDHDLIKWNIQIPKTEAERAWEEMEKQKQLAAETAAKEGPMTKARKAEIRKSIRRKQTAKLERVRADAVAAADRRRLLYSGGVRGGRGVLTPYAYPKVRHTGVLRPKVTKQQSDDQKRERAELMLRKYGPRLPRRQYPSLQVPTKPRPTGFFGRINAAVSDVRESIGNWLTEFRRQAFPRESETDELWKPKVQVPIVVTVDPATLPKPKASTINSRLNRLAKKTTLKARRRPTKAV